MTTAHGARRLVALRVPGRGCRPVPARAWHDLLEAESARDGDRPGVIRSGAVAELALGTGAPAVGPVVRGHPAGVRGPRDHLTVVQPAEDGERRRGGATRAQL